MVKFHLLFVTAVLTLGFIRGSQAQDCPSSCVATKKLAKKQCKDFTPLGCIVKSCISDDGTEGFSCAVPTSAPAECPAVCSTEKKATRKLCKSLSFLGCVFEKCKAKGGEKGWTCADPTPTPTECPAVCNADKESTRQHCKNFSFLGCTLQKCTTDSSKKGWTCAAPPTGCPETCRSSRKEVRRECKNTKALGCKVQTCGIGTSLGYTCKIPEVKKGCPGRCFLTKKDARKDCKNVKDLGCEVQKCLSAEGEGFSCGPVKLETGDKIEFVGPTVSERYDFSLKFKNEGSAVSVEDIYLLCDATGSMTGAISAAKERFGQVVANRSSVSGNVQFGVGIFRDETELDDGFQNLASITADTSSIYRAIDSITATGGGDADEANLVALYKIATEESIGWREYSRKIVVYFGDFPGHEPSCVGGLEITRELVIDALNDKDITVVAVNFGRLVTDDTSSSEGLNRPPTGYGCGSSTRKESPGQADDITDKTGGDVAETTDQTELINLISSLISSLPLTYESDTENCNSYMSTTYNPDFPFVLFPAEETTVTQTVQLLPGVCDLPTDSFECEYKYKASGAGIPPTVVQVNGVSGC